MTTYLVAFLLSMLASLVLTRVVRDVASARGLFDSPSEARKVHARPIPRLGGMAISIAFVFPLLGLMVIDNDVARAFWSTPVKVLGVLGGAAMMVAVGVVDDIRGLNATQKFAVQVGAALVAWFSGFRIEEIATPFGEPLQLGMLALPVVILWIVGVTNAMNLIDGLDGLAGGVALVTVVLLFIMGINGPNLLLALICAALGGALLGFLWYNSNPASIFMGDSGSLFLGYVLAVTAIWSSHKSSTVVSIAIPVIALAVPLADTSMAVLRRFIRGRPLFSADREHIHHRLLDLGLTHRQAVFSIYAVCLILGGGALALVYANGSQAAMILGALAIGALAAGRAVGWLDLAALNQSWRYGRARQYGAMGRVEAARVAAERIREAASIDDAVTALVEAAPRLDSQEIRVNFEIDDRSYARHWELGGSATLVTRSYGLAWELGEVSLRGTLVWGWQGPEGLLQLPEEPCLDFLTLVLRDKLLALEHSARRERCAAAGVEPGGPAPTSPAGAFSNRRVS